MNNSDWRIQSDYHCGRLFCLLLGLSRHPNLKGLSLFGRLRGKIKFRRGSAGQRTKSPPKPPACLNLLPGLPTFQSFVTVQGGWANRCQSVTVRWMTARSSDRQANELARGNERLRREWLTRNSRSASKPSRSPNRSARSRMPRSRSRVWSANWHCTN